MANRSDGLPDAPYLNRRSRKDTPLPGSRLKRKVVTKEPPNRKKAVNSPIASDGETKKRTGPQRRRIQVAVRVCHYRPETYIY